MSDPAAEPLLRVSRLSVRYPLRRPGLFAPRPWLCAVDAIDLSIAAGEVLGVVGESGSGKSTTARAIAGLLTGHTGTVALDGEPLHPDNTRRSRTQRRRIQMVFQDPYASLDPRMSAGAIIAEPLRNYGLANAAAQRERVEQLLDRVGLAAEHRLRYPHEFSGGQRQRIGVARALAAEPDLLICDEPVSALDVSIQAQVLNLLARLRREFALAMCFIAHDLAVVRYIADRIAVMYRGRIVELAPRDELFANPLHPYTRNLLRAIPRPDPRERAQPPVSPPVGPGTADAGCVYASRCGHTGSDCATQPALVEQAPGHWVACSQTES